MKDVYKRQERGLRWTKHHRQTSWVSDGPEGGCDFLEVVARQKVADELCVIGYDGLGGLPGN